MRVVFAGTPEFAVPCLQALIDAPDVEVIGVFTQPDRPAGRGKKILQSPVKKLALTAGLNVFQPLALKSDAEISLLEQLQPDLMVVTAYGLLLPQRVLDIPRLGCVNLHASLLPRWRGAAPIQRAIAAGDNVSGVTLMQIESKLDSGPMLAKSQIDIGEQTNAGDLHDSLSVMAGKLLADNLEAIKNMSLVAEVQDEGLVTYAHKLSKQESSLDWSRSAKSLALQIRAFNPWPGSTFNLNENKIRVLGCRVEENHLVNKASIKGEVISADKFGIAVQTNEDILVIEKLQKPGGKPMAVKDFLNGVEVTVGTVLSEL